ncbi:hypothetical protein B7R22_08185 [Subtercola boreus]|uniref:Acetone carboxylase n=1 Tax=Subtercola boreus TaxID=120213 RepID=A0A3E0VY80_9MICO|nr:hypothetical protein [Subtercola boreus]RFA14690.1 hypothetical protein B7R22_08185 [Subtercola boreus]
MSLLDALGGGSLGGAPGTEECSRAGCRTAAAWAIGWRNPKIHTEDRVKVWVACDEHVVFLREFLAARDFPLAVTPFGTVPDAATLTVAGV